jgi:hypothetical protein
MAIKTSRKTIIELIGNGETYESLLFEVGEDSVEVVARGQDRTMRLSFTRQEITELVAALQVHERFA